MQNLKAVTMGVVTAICTFLVKQAQPSHIRMCQCAPKKTVECIAFLTLKNKKQEKDQIWRIF